MNRRTLAVAIATAFLLGVGTGQAYGDGFEVGANVGAAVPLSKYKSTVDEDVGGTFGITGGYRFDLNEHVGLSLIANPQFTFFSTQDCCGKHEEDVSSVFIGGVGPKLTFDTGPAETWLMAQGAYYRDMDGIIHDEGAGWNAGGGVNFKITDASSLGLYARYDRADIRARPDSNQDRQFLLTGLAFNHYFKPQEPVRMVETPPPPPAAPPVRQKLVLRGVNFDFDKSNIRPDAQPILNEAADTLDDRQDVTVAVAGHTDAIGTDAYNQGLSERRADSVADYLSSRGISRGRLQTVGYGESQPVANNADPDGRAQNRRVELQAN